MTTVQKTLLLKVSVAIIETVREAGSMGAPAGPMYAALMAHGFSLENFEFLMSGLVNAKMLRKSGDLYFIARGAELKTSVPPRISLASEQG